MLFNSFEFIVWFLPVTVAVFFVLGRWRLERFAVAWLILASLFFYAWWRIEYLPLLAGSILFNYAVGARLAVKPSRLMLSLGVAANLAVLGYFKYSLFVLENVNLLLDTQFGMAALLLPLGISFFTFQQIAYLVDSYDGVTVERNFLNYALFVSFFPQLIAGPIVHHKEMLPQFGKRETFRPNIENIALGLTVFGIGLFKKVVIADRIAFYSTAVFGAAGAGESITFFEAWGGALAFTMQLYFDFSGYSDMAIGLGLIFGIRLPINFNSPYKAASIIEFWQRWHISLTRFLTAYVYNPVLMNLTRRRMAAGKPLMRRGNAHAGSFVVLLAFPTLFTMFLAGIWHGAGFQFIVFGVLHGVYLVVNHAWRAVCDAAGLSAGRYRVVLRLLSVLLTFGAVILSLVFFRAESLSHAMTMVEAMAGLNGFALPKQYAWYLGPLLQYVPDFVRFEWELYLYTDQVAALVFLTILVWTLPNTQEWTAFGGKMLDRGGFAARLPILRGLVAGWVPNGTNAVIMGIIVCVGLLEVLSDAPSEFLYFNF